MADGSSGTFRSQPWYRKVALIVLLPFVLPAAALAFLLVVGVFGVYAAVGNCVFERRVRSRMRRCGRFLRLHDVRQRIAAEGGTLIIEGPSLGWNFTHAWWTPDAVLGKSPFSVPTDEDYKKAAGEMKCLDWDKWCWDNYTCPENGHAFLLRVGNGASMERRLKESFPDLSVVHTWTALVHVQQPPDDANANAS